MATCSIPLTHGETLSTATSMGVRLTETIHRPGLQIDRHVHSEISLTLVISGSFEELLENRWWNCLPFDLILKPAGVKHANRYGAETVRSVVVTFDPADCFWTGFVDLLQEQKPHRFRGVSSALALKLCRDVRTGDPTAAVVAEELLADLMGEAAATKAQGDARCPAWLKQVHDCIREEPGRGWRLSTLAETASVHPVYLARAFRRHFGKSVGDHIRRSRVDRATRMLATSKTPVAAIALDCGFVDQAHFSHAFRRVTGATPARFRRELEFTGGSTNEQ